MGDANLEFGAKIAEFAVDALAFGTGAGQVGGDDFGECGGFGEIGEF